MTESTKEYIVITVIAILVLCGLLFISSCAMAQEPVTVDLEIIKQIESGGDPHSYNKESGATGLYQITQSALDDFNRFSNYRPTKNGMEYDYILWDLYSPLNSRIVALWYTAFRIPNLLKHFKHEDTLENRLIAYACGIKCLGKKLNRKTINYIKKYKELQ